MCAQGYISAKLKQKNVLKNHRFSHLFLTSEKAMVSGFWVSGATEAASSKRVCKTGLQKLKCIMKN